MNKDIRFMINLIFFIAAILDLYCCSREENCLGMMERIAESITIYCGAWEVPHVFRPTGEAVVFGAANAGAEDRFWRIHTGPVADPAVRFQ